LRTSTIVTAHLSLPEKQKQQKCADGDTTAEEQPPFHVAAWRRTDQVR
jgi:hypothetical protein